MKGNGGAEGGEVALKRRTVNQGVLASVGCPAQAVVAVDSHHPQQPGVLVAIVEPRGIYAPLRGVVGRRHVIRPCWASSDFDAIEGLHDQRAKGPSKTYWTGRSWKDVFSYWS